MNKELEDMFLDCSEEDREYLGLNNDIQDIVKSIEAHREDIKTNKYQRKVKSTTIDVYDVLVAFEVNNPAVAHAVKKLLASGSRGYKPVIQDLQEAIHAIERAIQIEAGE